MKHLEINAITVGYDQAVLHDFDLTVRRGEWIGIIGANGAGKSTLLKAITKLLPLEKGKIIVQGQDIQNLSSKQLARLVAVVNQSADVSFNYRVRDVVKLGRYAHKDQTLAAIEPFMKYTDVWCLRERGFHELSGGEKQRVIISQAFAQEADLIMMDEPTSDLDIRHQVDVFNVLEDFQREREVTIIAIMHDLNLAALYCNRLVALKDGQIVADGTPSEVLTPDHLLEIFGINVKVEYFKTDKRPVVMLEK